jgi:carboxymethylenebutenolidase
VPTELIETADGVADAYRTGAGPGVLLLIDAFGLRPQIERMAERIAAEGYTVLAPNVFYRAGPAPLFEMPDLSTDEKRAAFFQQLGPLIEPLTPERTVADGAAYLEHLPAGPVAITGYCMGARLGWRIAAAQPERVTRLAGFHAGRLVSDDPDSPHLSAARLNRAQVYFGHADNDPSNSPEQIATLERALRDAGVAHTSEVYAGARHGYTMADTPAYDEQASERHYAALFELLRR